MRRFLQWLPVALLSGCALDAGEGFAVLEPSVQAAYTQLPRRDAGDGYQALASDFQLRMDSGAVSLGSIDLLASSGGGGATTFDPSSPPPGYSLCHNGHCHSADGALVDYEDIQAELGGGGITTTTVANLPVDGELDLLAAPTVGLTCKPDCELTRTIVSSGRWSITGLRMTGSVRDGRVPARFAGVRTFRLTATTSGAEAEPLAVLKGDLDVPSDRENKPRVELGLKLALTPELFDAVDWSTAKEGLDGVVDLDAVENAAVRTALLQKVGEVSPTAEVNRGAW
ncbi:hypothetical protein D7Y13_34505 [Corallococcus praedator]|uniref:Lipoprotein n=1 Tax=Corallococcus praedator TaxID=2316724 RepID=A0ABX9Q7P8_9BACT|nr:MULTISPECIES: hypothetical protein [Corallococcus]RKH28378.1 hypothetical protein D7X75_24765 [Corallococcus sp. CA031C]RKH93424.1 hypothetical protein D7Y13_34505 [Corallococcus praedator]